MTTSVVLVRKLDIEVSANSLIMAHVSVGAKLVWDFSSVG